MLDSITHVELTGNYRSTQRIIDYYQQLRPEAPPTKSLASYADEPGLITFQNGTVTKNDLPATIAGLIRKALDAGIPPSEICVLAPHWIHVQALARSLVGLLPDVDFDAPGLSPIHRQRENIWFKIARLFLTTPSPGLFRTRQRWAGEVLRELDDVYGVTVPDSLRTPRQLLRLINATTSAVDDGLDYLRAVFGEFVAALDIDLNFVDALRTAYELFFEKAQSTLDDIGDDALRDSNSFRKLFRHPAGVVVSTCHGVKGEEYETVIAFGLLQGYVPHWNEIFSSRTTADDRASKLLFVVCSRAKQRLHLIAECGRFTTKQREYETTPRLAAIDFDYDSVVLK